MYRVKLFFKRANRLKNESYYPDFIYLDDVTTSTLSEKSRFFASFFKSVFTDDSNSNDIIYGNAPILQPLNIQNISLELSDILQGLLKLEVNIGPGLDGIPNQFLKHARYGLSQPLHYLFNKSLSEGLFPQIWKYSLVRPIYKSGDKSNIKNYRPIALINFILKFFEKLLILDLQPLFKSILIDQQHGFRADKSTAPNLVLLNNHLFSNSDSKHYVDIIYTDFSKAFDKVNFNILLQKISNYGITGSLLKWFRSYLTDRTYRVQSNHDACSDYVETSGVPQGSHFGSLLFNIFTNDISLFIEFCKFLLYADDAKFFHSVDSIADAVRIRKSIWITYITGVL